MSAPLQWSSRFGFLMAAVGFAVGLGNIWRFPYVTGENGGSAFVLIYLVCAFVIGVPIMMAEIMLGRRGGGSPPASIAKLAGEATSRWAWVGHLNLVTAFTIVTAYGVVAGWVLYYLYLAVAGDLGQMHSGVISVARFEALLEDVPTLMGWSIVVFLLAGIIVYAGVEKGIERAVTWLMPLLFVLLLILASYNAFAGGMQEALDYLFTPDFSKVTPGVFLAAIGQAFFSIGVAMAGMMMFGAYLPAEVSIARSAFLIVIADTAVALLAGLVIFPLVFANHLDPAGGTGLIFHTLPVAFAQMPNGALFGSLFFLLLSVAAITSVVGFVEPLVAWVSERFGKSRHAATGLLLGFAVSGSFISVLSYNYWADVSLTGARLATLIDFIPNQVFLPIGGLLIAVFAGWRLTSAVSREELAISPKGHTLWLMSLRFVVVPAVLIIFVTGVLN